MSAVVRIVVWCGSEPSSAVVSLVCLAFEFAMTVWITGWWSRGASLYDECHDGCLCGYHESFAPLCMRHLHLRLAICQQLPHFTYCVSLELRSCRAMFKNTSLWHLFWTMSRPEVVFLSGR